MDLEPEAFAAQVHLNYLGAVYAVKAVLPAMVGRGRGRVLLVASAAATIGFCGYGAYAPTKYALRGFAECLRNEVAGTGVRVGIAYPPDTDTPGFAEENKTKPAETLDISPPSLYAADEAARGIVAGLRGGQFHVLGPDLVQNLLVSTAAGCSPRALWFPLEVCPAPLLLIAQRIFRLWMDWVVMRSWGRGGMPRGDKEKYF